MSSRAWWSVHLAISRHMAAVFKLADFWHDIVEQYGAPSYVPTQVLPYYCWAGITVNEESEVWTRLMKLLDQHHGEWGIVMSSDVGWNRDVDPAIRCYGSYEAMGIHVTIHVAHHASPVTFSPAEGQAAPHRGLPSVMEEPMREAMRPRNIKEK